MCVAVGGETNLSHDLLSSESKEIGRARKTDNNIKIKKINIETKEKVRINKLERLKIEKIENTITR